MKQLLALTAILTVCGASAATANEGNMDAKAQMYFNKMDSNKDGKVTESEHEAFADAMFDKADSNNDDSVSLSELKAAKEREKAEWKNSEDAPRASNATRDDKKRMNSGMLNNSN